MYLIRRHSQSKQKLAQLSSGGTEGTQPSKDYQVSYKGRGVRVPHPAALTVQTETGSTVIRWHRGKTALQGLPGEL